MHFKQAKLNMLEDILESYTAGKHRDLVEDSREILNQESITYTVSNKIKTIPNEPTIIASNHYIRPFMARKNLLTTYESLYTSAIITQEVAKMTRRKLAWVVKNDLAESIGPFSIHIRDFQKKVIRIYDFIGVGKNYPFGQRASWASYLNRGYNIACYPEAKVSAKLLAPKPGLNSVINYLKNKKINVNILPVAVYWDGNKFVFSAADIVKTEDHAKNFEQITMHSIAAMLPQKLRGEYR